MNNLECGYYPVYSSHFRLTSAAHKTDWTHFRGSSSKGRSQHLVSFFNFFPDLRVGVVFE